VKRRLSNGPVHFLTKEDRSSNVSKRKKGN